MHETEMNAKRKAELKARLQQEIERDERIEASQERREDTIDAKLAREATFDFERDCGARS